MSTCTIHAVSGIGRGESLMQSNLQGWIQTVVVIAGMLASVFAAWSDLSKDLTTLQTELNAEVQVRQGEDGDQEKRLDRLERVLFEGRTSEAPPRGSPSYLDSPDSDATGG